MCDDGRISTKVSGLVFVDKHGLTDDLVFDDSNGSRADTSDP